MIIPPYGTATYRQIAAILREEILAHRIRPGYPLPSEATLQQTYGVAGLTARRAVDVLRAEGLADFQRGRGVMVRHQPERSNLDVPAGATLTSRMPTLDERDELDIGEGVPVFSVTAPDGTVEIYPADRWQVRMP
ncbi:hypothetical protein GCM10010172_80340 [Paractinoplanes ferrugineus]|uniref:HTH gntR-type domain-containing protein n=1 Tax=Paractinoplanes ferrugineus TaxID=113564 RepID=A0A919J8F0_9ACTN|nr:winged helix-turn-helix domain-containing protein [Actinoplanes ferrugineus]GIE16751.1 hypothetical protein Afe05nite_85910 [Actinoplanes ferrugineus]